MAAATIYDYGYYWSDYANTATAGTSGADTLNASDPVGSLVTIDAGAGTDIFAIPSNYQINIANFTVTTNGDGSTTISGASNTHSVNIKLVNFETFTYTDKSNVTHNVSLSSSSNTPTTGADTLTGTASADSINGLAGNDIISGLGGSDTLNGSSGNDSINGGSGNDTLIGGTGKDALTGGSGTDYFVFNATLNANTNVDTLKDFVHLTDKIQLDDDIFTRMGITGTNGGVAITSAKFYAGTAAHDATDRIIYNKATGALYYDADGNGTTYDAVKFAVVGTTTHPTLTYSDFSVIA